MKKFYSILLGIFVATNLFFGFGVNVPNAQATATQIYLTTTGANNWTVPSDWNSANNTIEVIGAGSNGSKGTGGSGGSYSAISNLTLTPGASIAYSVGASGGGDTWLGNASYASANVAARGGGGAGGIGTTKYTGGSGGWAHSAGGAAGPHGNGLNGGVTDTPGGKGDNGYGGNGGTYNVSGGAGTEWDATHGCGGGGHVTSGTYSNSDGGRYGGGGGAGYGADSGRSGYQGLIVITYTPAAGPTTVKTANGLLISTGVKTKNGVTPATTKSYQGNQ